MQNKKTMRAILESGFFLGVVSILAACGAGGSGEGEGGGNVTIPVTTGLLQSLTITPSASSVAACSPVNFTATGHYSDNTTANVTASVVWQIDPANSDVAIAHPANGRAVALNAGSATLYAWTGSISASAVLNVTGGNLVSIAITPASATAAAGGTQPYTATATCTGGTADISNMNVWSSSNSAVSTVSALGVATGVVAGSSVISATAGLISASSVLNVQ
jgi:hypothetical protein